MQLLAEQIGDKGEIAILSAAANATNQNTWIGFMKDELKKYPKTEAGQGRLRQRRRPDLPADPGPAAGAPEPEGHHLPDHRRHRGRRPYLSGSKYKGKVS